MYNFGRLDFPNQHVSYAEKQEVDWYAKCCDYVIEAGIACNADFENPVYHNYTYHYLFNLNTIVY